jgi:drug/metabolite transporter (DMT)-like permease
MDRFVFIGATLALTLYAQIIVKSRALVHAPDVAGGRFGYLIAMYTDWRVLSGFACGVLASVTWALALERTPISYAYPFMALSFVLVPMAAVMLFGESLSPLQMLGIAFVVVGVSLTAFSS